MWLFVSYSRTGTLLRKKEPMKFELHKIDPWRAAKIAAAVYGVFLVGGSVLVLPLILIYAMLQDVSLASLRISVLGLVAWLCLGPLLGACLGYAGAAAYNLVVRWTGGLLIEGQPHLPLLGALKNGIQERLAPRKPGAVPHDDTF